MDNIATATNVARATPGKNPTETSACNKRGDAASSQNQRVPVLDNMYVLKIVAQTNNTHDRETKERLNKRAETVIMAYSNCDRQKSEA